MAYLHRMRRPTVDINDPADLRRWSRKFDCEPQELIEAAGKVGDMAHDIKLAVLQRRLHDRQTQAAAHLQRLGLVHRRQRP